MKFIAAILAALSLAIAVSALPQDIAAPDAPAAPASRMTEFADFVRVLQDAVEAEDRDAVIDMVHLPLRVNGPNGTYHIRNREYLEQHFEQVFDERTRAAVLAQDPDEIFARDMGGMIGDGEVWFDYRCEETDCAGTGKVAVYVVNHIVENEATE